MSLSSTRSSVGVPFLTPCAAACGVAALLAGWPRSVRRVVGRRSARLPAAGAAGGVGGRRCGRRRGSATGGSGGGARRPAAWLPACRRLGGAVARRPAPAALRRPVVRGRPRLGGGFSARGRRLLGVRLFGALGMRFLGRSVFPAGRCSCRRTRRSRVSERCFVGGLFGEFPVFPAAGWLLPWLECFRYCLPNFPHSPAGHGRERQRLHAFLADGAQTALLLQIDSTCRSSWRLPGTACRDARATASGRGPSPSIRGGHPESGRTSFRVSLFSKYSSISFFHSS